MRRKLIQCIGDKLTFVFVKEISFFLKKNKFLNLSNREFFKEEIFSTKKQRPFSFRILLQYVLVETRNEL